MQKSSVDGTLVVPLATKGLEHQIQNPKKKGKTLISFADKDDEEHRKSENPGR